MPLKTESQLKYIGYTVAAVLGLLAVVIFGLVMLESSEYERDIKARLDAGEKLLAFHLEKDAEKISSVMDAISTDDDVIPLLKNGDRAKLLELYEPVYFKLNRDYRITHFYFHRLDGTNLLRVHQPKRHGDKINRISLQKAMKYDRPSHAIEMGPLGTLTLRVVYPVKEGVKTIGYMELGEEIGHIMESLKQTLGNDWIFAIYKENLEKLDWESGVKVVGTRSQWDDFKSIVVVNSSFPENYPQTFDILENPPPRLAHDTEISIGMRFYHPEWISMNDATLKEVGKIFLFFDVTEQRMIERRLIMTVALLGLLCAVGIVAFFMVSLSRQKRVMHASHLETLLEESKKRENDRQAHLLLMEKAQEALKEQGKLLGLILDTIPTPITYKDSEGNYLGINTSFSNFFGLDKEFVKGKKPDDVFHGDDAIIHQEADMSALRTGQSVSYEMRMRDAAGKFHDVYITKSIYVPEGSSKPGVVGVIFDISERKEIERKLREREERLRSIFENAMDGIFAGDPSGRFTSANPAFLKMMGYSEDELYTHTLNDITHPDDRRQSSIALAQVLTGTKSAADIEKRLVTRSGDEIWVRLAATWVFDERKNPLFTIGIVHDVTAEKAVEEERKRLITAVSQADEAIVVTDSYGEIEFVNPAFEKITGYSPEEVIGKTHRLLKSGAHTQEFYENMWKTIREGRVWRGIFINRKKNGETYKERCTISPVRDNAGKIMNYVSVKQDISRETELEDQLRQAQKMEAVGTLAGGVAHDFNNLLQVISGCTQLLAHNMETQGMGQNQYLEKISSAVDRGAELVSRILTFSRPSSHDIHTFSINLNVANAIKMLEQALPKNIKLENHLEPALSPINGVPDQIEQIVINLATNARDAMPEGGTLCVTTRNVYMGGPGGRKDSFVMLTVEDSGHGIDPKVRERIFEPFFTTKEVGKGTGLGLYTVYNIVKNHGGEITCASSPGEGTRFEILFPVSAERRKAVRDDRTVAPSRLPEGSETILMVDDEPSILQSTKELLEIRGFKAITALSGEDAIDIYQKQWENIDLVLIDVGMPGMGGIAAIKELKRINPLARIIVASGFAESPAEEAALDNAADKWVRKPFRFDRLVLAVREVLDKV